MNKKLSGVITALATPMLEDKSIDYHSLKSLIHYQLTNQIEGIVLLGSTGEAATQTQTEHLELIEKSLSYVLEFTHLSTNQVNVNIIVGVGQGSTREAIKWVEQLNSIKEIKHLLVVTPPYIKPTAYGLYEHFRHIAEATDKQVIVYNVPGRTGCNIDIDTVIKLSSQYNNITGIKDANCDMERLYLLHRYRSDDFAIYSGDDLHAMAWCVCGADGVVSVAANLIPRTMRNLLNYCFENKINMAHKLNSHLLDLYQALSVQTNPIALKWMLKQAKIIASSALRLPLTTLDQQFHPRSNAVMHELSSAGLI